MKPTRLVAHKKLTRQQIWELKRLWREIPHVECKGLCQDECAHVPIYPIEALYILERHPEATILPALHGEKQDLMPTLGVGAPCCFLDSAGRCSIYEDRPVICRLFGHTNTEFIAELDHALNCQHGCKSTKPLTNDAALEILRRLVEIFTPAGTELASPRQWWKELERQFNEMQIEVDMDQPWPWTEEHEQERIR